MMKMILISRLMIKMLIKIAIILQKHLIMMTIKILNMMKTMTIIKWLMNEISWYKAIFWKQIAGLDNEINKWCY